MRSDRNRGIEGHEPKIMTETTEKTGFKIEASALRAYTMLGALIIIWIFFYWMTDGIFLSPLNLSNLMTQTSVTGILAVGMLMVIISGNIDLSVGSVLALAGGLAAITLMKYGLPAAILASIAVCVAIGVFHGVLTAYAKIPAFIVTLGGLLAWRGAVKGITSSETIPIADPVFKGIGQSYIAPQIGWVLAAIAVAAVLFGAYRSAKSQKDYGLGEVNLGSALIKAVLQIAALAALVYVMNLYVGVPIPVMVLVALALYGAFASNSKALGGYLFAIGAIIAFTYIMNSYAGVPIPVMILLAVALFGAFVTNSTTFGRYLYAIGGNADAARLSGINNKVNVLKVYALLGALTGLAAVIFTARLGSATPDAGVLKELDAIAACVIGGASLMGGRGTVFGACLGALIMASLDNGMSLRNVSDFMQELIKGSILVLAVGIDMIGRKDT